MSARKPRVGVVVLTQGRRPDDLARALDSVAVQTGVTVDVAVVGNGYRPTGLARGVTAVYEKENIGIPAGRNAGVPHVTGDYLLFLDDDAALGSPDFLARAIDLLEARPEIGVIQPRVETTDGVSAPRRWIPRLRKGRATQSSPCMFVWEGAVVMPRDVYEAVGGWGDPYFYAHEGIELAWRVWNHDRIAWYAADLVARHPFMQPTRHDDFYRLNARNRVWLAKRNLPPVLGFCYVVSWAVVQHVRWLRAPRGLRQWWRGIGEGLRENPGGRVRLRATTLWRMWRAGRLPII